ncbi:uncharacterized protein EDB91DRAFT_1333729 [Suillus paluster]|uniref:uncharacterized protein n=1 Tax=Suillus paluster TaxID=48578 RepID=UPI001B86C715|nr:uncharacterized protein EDB91DRAFT_1333729 [Suillus paluster]KAG1751416.1 hypothetical protein EDB91DRAFT_1333729 [Suillus paluster]
MAPVTITNSSGETIHVSITNYEDQGSMAFFRINNGSAEVWQRDRIQSMTVFRHGNPVPDVLVVQPDSQHNWYRGTSMLRFDPERSEHYIGTTTTWWQMMHLSLFNLLVWYHDAGRNFVPPTYPDASTPPLSSFRAESILTLFGNL